jgi:predicted transcriptional regulator of viral defense system
MKQLTALAKLQELPLFESKDVAALLQVTRTNATQIAERLARAGLLLKLSRGKWALPRIENLLAIPEFLTSPYPAYVSLQSALYLHGMISQIPAVTYAVSLARPKRYPTPLGTFSIHHVASDFFFGFELDQTATAKIALPEKALVDLFYFAPARTRLFARLPEVEIPRSFRWTKAAQFAARIKSLSRRRMVEEKLAALRRAKS